MRRVAGPIYSANFEAALLSRGFWLYVWEIMPPDGLALHYVGKTGDKASRVCQSPFNRLTHHLGDNKHSNALSRHLRQTKIDPEICHFRFHAYGSLFGGISQMTHGELCDVTSGLEKALANAMAEAGYKVINQVHCHMPLDVEAFAGVCTAFAAHFDKLATRKGTLARNELATAAKKHGGHR